MAGRDLAVTGGLYDTILPWNTGEPGKWVKIKPCGQDRWCDAEAAKAALAGAVGGWPKAL